MINRCLSLGAVNDDDVDLFEIVFGDCETIDELYSVAEDSDFFSEKPRHWLYNMAMRSPTIRKKIFPKTIRKCDKRERFYMVHKALELGLISQSDVSLKTYAFIINSSDDAYDLSKKFKIPMVTIISIMRDVEKIRDIPVPDEFSIDDENLNRFFRLETGEPSEEKLIRLSVPRSGSVSGSRLRREGNFRMKEYVLNIIKDGPKPLLYLMDRVYETGRYISRRDLFDRSRYWGVEIISDKNPDKRVHFAYSHPSLSDGEFESVISKYETVEEMICELNKGLDGINIVGEYTILYYMRKLGFNDKYEQHKRTKAL